jgi:preprotein translocase subunit SecE
VAEDHEQQDETEGQEPTVRPVTAAARRERRASARAASAGPTSDKADARPKTAAAARARRAKAADAEAGKAPLSKAEQGIATRKRAVAEKGEKRPSVFGRLLRFLREVVSELRKVIWPTRKQQLTYTVVVLVFVAFVVAFVSGLDYGFTKLVFLVFS